ncbi:MAG: AGE family epimerase/isomerase [Candidatus Latescibacteria bacterium]|nr:AGE family epimerase/isomerase [Candidatus Latescibacterota bacterium]
MAVCGFFTFGLGEESMGKRQADRSDSTDREAIMHGAFWRDQALHDIMPAWLAHGINPGTGRFYTGLTRDWKPIGSSNQYPTMLGRHLFSLSAAYLLSGEERYLALAKDTASYLIEHGWDHTYGGWYDSITETGAPESTTKRAFTQMYANTGLALYFFATRDPDALRCLERSNEIFETHAWDSEHEGYYVTLNRDLSVADTQKSFNPQIGLLSSYMLYWYLADGRPALLSQMERTMDVALRRMQAPRDGFILDTFDRAWHCATSRWEDGTEVLSAGGNIETSWIWMRLYHLTGNEAYRKSAVELGEKMIRVGSDGEHGGWYESFARDQTERHGPNKAWFIQAYGNFMVLSLFNQREEARYLDLFRETALFWNQYILDPEFGGAYCNVDLAGNLVDGTKGGGSKGSYHSMEHCLLNVLYLDLYVHKGRVPLYFNITSERSAEHLVCPVEDPAVHIAEATLDGKAWTDFDAVKRSVSLPAGKQMKLRVVLTKP